MSKILVVVDDDFDLGFKLTGIDTQRCVSISEAKECLEREIIQQRYGLILIDENFLSLFDVRLQKKVQETTKPLIMGIPLTKSFKKELQAKDYFLKMVQEAIGYEIRIR